MTERAYWEKLKKIGWLEYIPKSLQAEIRARFKKNYKTDPTRAHLSLNQTGFDSECIEGIGSNNGCSYHDVLKQLAKDSGGVFHPTHIKDEFVKHGRTRSINVSFRHDRTTYACNVPDSDYFDMSVLDLVNEALEASGRDERFIVVPSDDQLVFIVIVPPEVYERAVDAKLIPASRDVELRS